MRYAVGIALFTTYICLGTGLIPFQVGTVELEPGWIEQWVLKTSPVSVAHAGIRQAKDNGRYEPRGYGNRRLGERRSRPASNDSTLGVMIAQYPSMGPSKGITNKDQLLNTELTDPKNNRAPGDKNLEPEVMDPGQQGVTFSRPPTKPKPPQRPSTSQDTPKSDWVPTHRDMRNNVIWGHGSTGPIFITPREFVPHLMRELQDFARNNKPAQLKDLKNVFDATKPLPRLRHDPGTGAPPDPQTQLGKSSDKIGGENNKGKNGGGSANKR